MIEILAKINNTRAIPREIGINDGDDARDFSALLSCGKSKMKAVISKRKGNKKAPAYGALFNLFFQSFILHPIQKSKQEA